MTTQSVGPRYCKLELSGESNIYICPRDEYCCNVGCCISPSFQFYQLWYYWFMVFFMFLICSGGQWWYRYMLQGRCTSAMPPPPRRASYPRQCRVAYTPARDTVVLHHLWKPVGVNGPPPSYSQSGASGSSGPGVPKPSPYMQLYGPPPSYESVIGSGPTPIIHHPVGPHPPLGIDGPSLDHTVQLTEAQRFDIVPPASHHQHHHHQESNGAVGSSHQQSASGEGQGQVVNGTQIRRCFYQIYPHHYHHSQKATTESGGREICQISQVGEVNGGGIVLTLPTLVEGEERASAHSQPSDTQIQPLEASRPEQERTVVIIPGPDRPPSPPRLT